MQGKGAPLPLQPSPKSNHNTKTKTKTKNNNKIKVVYTENLTDPIFVESLRRAPPKPSRFFDRSTNGGGHRPPRCPVTGDTMIPLSEFPTIDATLNATSALLLTLGYFCIRRKKIQAHKVCMLSAFATSSLFLGCYLWYHAHHGVT